MEHILEEINPFITEELFWKNSQKWIIWLEHGVLLQHFPLHRLLEVVQLLLQAEAVHRPSVSLHNLSQKKGIENGKYL